MRTTINVDEDILRIVIARGAAQSLEEKRYLSWRGVV